MSGGYGFLANFGGVGVLPGLEESVDDGQLFVGALIIVNGARPPITPEFLSQVPNGLRESPAEYRFRKFSIQFAFGFGVGEVALLAALEESGADLSVGVGGGSRGKGLRRNQSPVGRDPIGTRCDHACCGPLRSWSRRLGLSSYC